jgi:hypothetical protein
MPHLNLTQDAVPAAGAVVEEPTEEAEVVYTEPDEDVEPADEDVEPAAEAEDAEPVAEASAEPEQEPGEDEPEPDDDEAAEQA